MPVDMPPVDHTPLQLQQSTIQDEIRLEAKGFLYTVRGNTLLPEDAIKAILNQAENPLQAARLIREAYAKKGYVLVNVQPSVSGNYAIFLVQEYRITRIEGPEYAKIYMSSLINRKDVLQAEFNRKLANALNEAARKGERLEYRLNPSTTREGEVDLILEPKKVAELKTQNASIAFSNYGNRYVGRYYGVTNFQLHPGYGSEVNVGVNQLAEDFGDTPNHANYTGANIDVSKTTRWGVFGAGYNFITYHYPNGELYINPALPGCSEQNINACLYLQDVIQDGEIHFWNLNASHILYVTPTFQWSISERFDHVDHSLNSRSGYSLQAEHYNMLSLTSSFAHFFQSLGQQATLNYNLGITKGLSGNTGTLGVINSYGGAAQGSFWIGKFDLGYSQPLPWRFTNQTTLRSQFASKTLPQDQQFFLGGFENLSAWMPGAAVGDHGYILSNRLFFPQQRWFDIEITPFIFAENGGVRYNTSPYRNSWTYMTDAGGGLSVNVKKLGTVYLTAAGPIGQKDYKEPDQNDERSDVYFYVGLNYGFTP
jgi:hemolysin activation/secretion protein